MPRKASNDLYSCFLFHFMSQKMYYHVCIIMMASNIHYSYLIYERTYYNLRRILIIEILYEILKILRFLKPWMYTKFHNILRYYFIPLINGLKPYSNVFTPNHINLTKDILRRCINQKTLKCRIVTHWRWCDNIFFADYCNL